MNVYQLGLIALIASTVITYKGQFKDNDKMAVADICREICDRTEGHGYTYYFSNSTCVCSNEISNRLYWQEYCEVNTCPPLQ